MKASQGGIAPDKGRMVTFAASFSSLLKIQTPS